MGQANTEITRPLLLTAWECPSPLKPQAPIHSLAQDDTDTGLCLSDLEPLMFGGGGVPE